MGHTRLGTIPKTKKWDEVVSAVASIPSEGEADPPETVKYIASKTIEAVKAGLENAINDYGLQFSFFLLTQIVLASRDNKCQNRLSKLGIKIDEDSNIVDFVSDVQNKIDDFIFQNGKQSDISETAQQAVGEALTTLIGPETTSLFDSGRDELLISIRRFSTKKGFATLSQHFFGSFLSRYLNFYLSRITAAQTGTKSIPQLGKLSRFNMSFKSHCKQTASIIRNFSGEWYSKTEYLEGIDLKNSSRFLAVALSKIQAELELQRKEI